MSDSVRPHRRPPTRPLCPWDSPGKNTVVDFHFLLQCMKVKSESEVAQSCLTLSDPMDCSPPGSTVHGIFQARVLEWGAIDECNCCVQLFATPWTIQFMEFSRLEYWSGLPFPSPGQSYQPRDQTQVSHFTGGFFTSWATREAQEYWSG